MSQDLIPGLSHVPPRRRRRHLLLTVPSVMASLLLVVGLIGGTVLVTGKLLGGHAVGDFTGEGTGSVRISVHPGDTITEIASTLVEADVVKSVNAFIGAAAANDQSRNIQPGIYQLRKEMSAQAALGMLLDPTNLVGARVTIPEGSRLSKIKQIVEKESTLSAAQIDAALADTAKLGLPAYAKGPEGFLFPATYNIDDKTTAASLFAKMVAEFNGTAKAVDLVGGAAKLKMTPYDVVKVASLVEAEVKRPEDYGKVARVIYNRLDKGMKLQLDSTVNYALNSSTLMLSQAQLDTPSPYNTYVHKGLPPGPIDSPGKSALEAALHPTVGDWIYFVTTDPQTGETQFTTSDAEFAKLKQQLRENLAKQSAGPSGSAAAK